MNVLIDTTIWSEALRRNNSRSDSKIVATLQTLIKEGRAQIIGPIRQEILSGINNDETFQKLKQHLAAFPDTLLTTDHYELAAEMHNLCRKKGIQGSHIDFLICAAANSYHFSIFTLDQDFKSYARHLDILLFP